MPSLFVLNLDNPKVGVEFLLAVEIASCFRGARRARAKALHPPALGLAAGHAARCRSIEQHRTVEPIDANEDSAGSVVPAQYDPMIAKVICWNRDRPSAIARMEAALRSMRITGSETTIPYHLAILGNAYFRRGEVDTKFIQRRMNGSVPAEEPPG